MSAQNVTIFTTFTQTVAQGIPAQDWGLPLLIPLVFFGVLVAFVVVRNRRKPEPAEVGEG